MDGRESLLPDVPDSHKVAPLPACCLNHENRTWTCARVDLVRAVQDELGPLVAEARALANDKRLASGEVFRAVDNIRMWLDAALATDNAHV
jgi:hypothetical protein